MMNKKEILKILEKAVDKNGDIPMRLVRQAFDKLPEECDDAVSREDALLCLTGEFHGDTNYIELIAKFGKRIKQLPPVTPKRKTGKWISHRPPDGFVLSLFSCDQCGYVNLGRSKYCPNCGARMDRGEQG